MDNPLLYIASAYEAFHDEPESFDEFLKFAGDATANKNDAIRSMIELMIREHKNLLEGLSIFFPNLNRFSDVESFLKNAKKRFEKVDTHVYYSVISVLNMCKDRKKSFKKTRKEILNLLYYHEDLTEEFSRLFPKP